MNRRGNSESVQLKTRLEIERLKLAAESLELLAKACAMEPRNARYAYSRAFFLHAQGKLDEAVAALEPVVSVRPVNTQAVVLLGDIHVQMGARAKAAAVYRRALEDHSLNPRDRAMLEDRLRAARGR